MSGVLIVGSVNADLVFRLQRFPVPGETVGAHSFHTLAGGKGANQAAACAQMGAEAMFCGSFGTDSLADFLRATVTDFGVDLQHATSATGPSGSAVILVNDAGENQIVVSAGANALLGADHVRRAISECPAEIILAQQEVPEAAVLACVVPGRRLILNPAPFRPVPPELLAGLFAITPNESEMASLTGIEPSTDAQLRAGASALLELGVQNVVVTLGAKGCYWTNGSEEVRVKALPVSPVDTTGAGDVFNGALAARISTGDSIPDALKWASAAASLSTTGLGAMDSTPSLESVVAALANWV